MFQIPFLGRQLTITNHYSCKISNQDKLLNYKSNSRHLTSLDDITTKCTNIFNRQKKTNIKTRTKQPHKIQAAPKKTPATT